MSSRVLKKLQNDDALLDSILSSHEAKENHISKENVNKNSLNKKPNFNNFMSLMDDEENEDNADESGNDEDEEGLIKDKEINNINSTEDELTPVKKFSLPTKSQKKNLKKKKKAKKLKKNINQDKDEEDEEKINEEDSDFDDMLRQFQKQDILKYGNISNPINRQDSDGDEFFSMSETEDPDHDEDSLFNDLYDDPGFSKFKPQNIKRCSKFFNDDFKLLDPHTEFKLLFDDLSPEALEDIDSLSSTSISPQQLKQIQRLRRLVRNWDGKDHRNVPNGPGGSTHKLQFTKIRQDWLPTQRGEVCMSALSDNEIRDWQLWQRPSDWKEVIEEDMKIWKKYVTYYKFTPLNEELNKKSMTEFYLSVVLHPDHEALTNLIFSQFPYYVPGLLQVSLILIRQGDKSNTNGLLQRALFVFDRALKMSIKFDGLACQLPYTYFFNRQFYLAIFRYISSLAQRGAVGTAAAWCKALWSFSPLEDPLGVRYFIDHYLLLNKEYNYLIELSKSPLVDTYSQWFTLGLSLSTVLSFLSIDEPELAKNALRKAFKYNSVALAYLFVETLAGERSLIKGLNIDEDLASKIETKAYMTRFPQLWTSPNDIAFLNAELKKLLREYQDNKFQISIVQHNYNSDEDSIDSHFFIKDIPINLLRFAILSGESSIMGSIPEEIWSDYKVFEFDVLPPCQTTRESKDALESIETYIDEKHLVESQMARAQDENLLNQIRQLSLEQFLDENPNAGLE
ncbi:hypothetical protein TBLA_0A03280 [Henningerozyma blattae CBS 6284]|uniref:Ribosome quality control complex subunit 1 n=1 Tax=Henningerozyma blattae (strain ATCC 34711 / CBS 6284 / DSM 70876 / NBRC 10599 / NRRL Y-10934 / UCD 77-7) TaxID=1071380 RepID=I2GVH6_HENB6|nr:hypothetical protein TBLA_0A03280 [Tetrapisispora blattae CBS 6284]CCH58128.1 hypothetical protein TBLA_0A03280 [Tetrapisispora blattae CBS 6284]